MEYEDISGRKAIRPRTKHLWAYILGWSGPVFLMLAITGNALVLPEGSVFSPLAVIGVYKLLFIGSFISLFGPKGYARVIAMIPCLINLYCAEYFLNP